MVEKLLNGLSELGPSEMLDSICRSLRVAQRVLNHSNLTFDQLMLLAKQIEEDTPDVDLAEIEYGFWLAGVHRSEGR